MANVRQEKKYLIVISGPTAVGKTSLTFKLSKHFECPVISADSRQVYKEMNIGTAKPSAQEISASMMKLVDHISIQDEYNAGIFEKEADAIIRNIFEDNQFCILSGGTGLYIKAVCEGLNTFPDVPKHIIAELTADLNKYGIQSLRDELKTKDPSYHEIVDTNNPHRLIRALSICRHTGKTFSSFLNGNKKKHEYKIIKIVLERDREELYDIINQRVLDMIDEGLTKEVRTLYPHRLLKALQTVGYKELFQHFDGILRLEEAIN
ncbi:MAG: tRNA (adenosine(37)-N6)-dimethylallyltransferase MiaA [Saprospiraceae bacterium]|nr:tRNA (adenosine(37)-N6)-dimethylallyltransferase MiaA [Saprospiraceae bacterium]